MGSGKIHAPPTSEVCTSLQLIVGIYLASKSALANAQLLSLGQTLNWSHVGLQDNEVTQSSPR